MSPDEILVFLFCAAASVISWGIWCWQCLGVAQFGTRWQTRLPLLLAPPFCALLLFAVLKAFAAEDVRYDPTYLGFYMVMGAAWVGLAKGIIRYFGVSARDDVIERGNPAASAAIAGALIGITLAFAGGNIGNGPGWWVVVFAASLATLTLFLLWMVLAQAAGLAETITVERDLAGGIRAAGFFAGAGLILGRAVAGDWHSAEATVTDFVKNGWPALVLTVGAFVVEKQLRPAPGRAVGEPMTGGGLLALAYLGFAVAAVALIGWWK